MSDNYSFKKIAEIKNGFSEKFGIPRQSGLCSSLKSRIVFEPDYRNPEAFRDLDGFSHIWLIWHFSQAVRDDWSPTVRPPRLGGNKRTGVFATRSPFRPNSIGLSCVKLDKIEFNSNLGPVLHISGADLMDGTPIFDIKPYIPYADCIANATDGFLTASPRILLEVDISKDIACRYDNEFIQSITEILSEDPRPAYQNDPERIYKMSYDGYQIEFLVKGTCAHITNIYKEK